MSQPTICRIVKLFYQLRVWQDEKESASRKTKLFYLFLYFLFQVSIATCAFLSDDNSERTFLVVALVLSVVMLIKLTYTLLRKDEIFGFLYNPIFDKSTKDRNELKLSLKITNFIRFVRAFLFIISVGCVFVNVSCLPIFSSEKRLPLFIRFTLTCKYSSIIYWLLYAFIAFIALFSLFSTLLSVLIWYVMFNYSIEYEVLGNKLRNLRDITATKVLLKRDIPLVKQNILQHDLIGLIKDHRQLFE